MGRLFVLACFVLLGIPASGLAVDLEKLVMPGEVIRGHAEIEANCRKCHSPFREADQNILCLDCHTAVAKGNLITEEGPNTKTIFLTRFAS